MNEVPTQPRVAHRLLVALVLGLAATTALAANDYYIMGSGGGVYRNGELIDDGYGAIAIDVD